MYKTVHQVKRNAWLQEHASRLQDPADLALGLLYEVGSFTFVSPRGARLYIESYISRMKVLSH